MVGSWGEVGHLHSWDGLQGLTTGQKCNAVIQLACVEPQNGSALGVLYPNNCNVRVSGLERVHESTHSLTLIDARFEGVNRIPTFKVTADTLVVQHRPVHVAHLYNVVELCAGIGIATTGLDFVGFSTKLAVELRAPFANVFSALNPQAKVITGDINDPQCLRQILQHAPGSSTLVAGFNCQPYSKAGTMRGIHDPRAESLHGVLQAAFYLRSPIVALECVVEAASNRHVQSELQQFCSQCGYHMSDVVLKLEDVWPCRRERWWVVLSAAALGRISLKPLPSQPYPTSVKHVLPRPLVMDSDDLEQLQIVGVELERFLRFRPDLQSMMVSLQGKCPTLLHSLGSQATECMCGCRNQGFADTTLAKGLFGIIMPVNQPNFVADSHAPQVRHPHPNEVALLSAIIPKSDWKCHHRLALAGIGQQANPIHAMWIGSQIIAHLEFVMEGQVTVSIRSILDDYVNEVLTWCRNAPLVSLECAPTASEQPSLQSPTDQADAAQDVQMIEPPCTGLIPEDATSSLLRCHGGDNTTATVVCMQTGAHVSVVVHSQATVGHLITAEAELQGSGVLIEILDPITQDVLDEAVLIGGRCLWVRSFQLPAFEPSEVRFPMVVVPPHELSPTIPFVAVEQAPVPGGVVAEGSAEMSAVDGALCSEKQAAVAPTMNDQDALFALTAAQLTELLPPVVNCSRHMEALLAQTISNEARSRLLNTQGAIWADDEIRWHLWQCMDRTTKPGVVMLDPLVATTAARVPSLGLLSAWFQKLSCDPKIIITAVCLDSHWSPMFWTWTPECLLAHSWDLPGLIPNTKCLNDALSKVVGARTFSVRVLHRMDGVNVGCGVCAVRYIDHCLTGRMLPTSKDDIEYLSGIGKEMFRRHVQHAMHLVRPWCWGNGLESQAHARLIELLQQHGVPSDLTEQRAHLVTQAIGVPPLQKCLTGSAPWRSLKALANQCQPSLQLVLPDELKAVIDAKASAGNSSRRTKGKSTMAKSVPVKPPPLDPTKLTFDSGAFVNDSGAPLACIPVSQLGPLAEGVALASISDIEPFLRSGKTVSSQCLAVFLLNVDESKLVTDLVWAQSRVALRCIANGEPMLINGYLVQLGKKHAIQARTKHVVEVQSLPAACLKIAIYRDGVTGKREDVVNAPIRYLLQCLEPLASCSQPADQCSCCKWHANDETGVKDPIFDLWRRQWLSLSMKVASPMHAELFMVNVRYAQAVEFKVLQLSGSGGVFLEPRSLDAREPVPEYQVLWMARHSLADLMHLRQCNPGVVGLARLGARFGLRIKASDMGTLGKTLKPEAILLGGGPRMDFELGPVPFGLDRAGLARLCQEWGWMAKPINPTKSVPSLGAVWHIQSCAEPPSTVVSLKGGADVVISKVAPKQQQQISVPSAVASAETLGLCKFQSVDAPSLDPWLLKDPWSQSAGKVASIKGPTLDLEASLHQVEQRVERAVLAKLPPRVSHGDKDHDMEGGSDETMARLQDLEAQVNRLTTGHQQLGQRIDEAGRKADAQISQLQHQMTAQLEGQGARIEDLFRGQMAQIESLLNKKARHE